MCLGQAMYVISAFVSPSAPVVYLESVLHISVKCLQIVSLWWHQVGGVIVWTFSGVVSVYFWIILFWLKAKQTCFLLISGPLYFSILWPLCHINSIGYLNGFFSRGSDRVGKEVAVIQKLTGIPIVLESYCPVRSQGGK